jgi:hypothetical protein
MNDGCHGLQKSARRCTREQERERGRIRPGFREYFDPENTDLSPSIY